jgi:hypothetical protein
MFCTGMHAVRLFKVVPLARLVLLHHACLGGCAVVTKTAAGAATDF